MSASAVEQYRRLVRELWIARAIAPGGELSQDEEAIRAEELSACRDDMTEAEQALLEEELRRPGALQPHAAVAPVELPARRGA